MVEHGIRMRVLWVSSSADALVAIDVDAKRTMPQWVKRSEWEGLRDDGRLELLFDDPYVRLPVEEAISNASRDRRDRAWACVAGMVCDEPAVFASDTRAKMIASAATVHGVHADTVRNWLLDYWKRGMTRNALLSDWDRCGGPGKDKATSDVKRGRPRSISPGTGMNVDEEVKRIFEVVIKNYYLKNPKATLRGVWRTMLRKFFSDCVAEEGGRLILRDVDRIPSYRSFDYWFRKTRNLRQEVVARKGRKFWEKTLRPLLGNSTNEAIGPGFRYQIDATIADVYLVSKASPKDIIGRPVLYVVIDVWSRMIAGIYVGIEKASWAAAMMALLNAGSNKVEFCAQYGIEIEAEQWPCESLSSVLLGDRGELESKLAERLSNVLQVKVENTPPYRADWKGIVERNFGSLHTKFAPLVDGYIDVDYQERGGRDYRLDATLTLDDFLRVIIHSVLEHNGSVIDGYPLTVEMSRDGVVPSPNELWKWGIRKRSGSLKRYSLDTLRFALMHTAKATVTGSGIEFHSRQYLSEYALERGWFSKARRDGKWKVDISYDPRNLDVILLHDTFDRRLFKVCRLSTKDTEQYGLSLQELLSMQRQSRRREAEAVHGILEEKINREEEISRIVERARHRKEEAGPDRRSKAERTGNIKGNGERERDVQRKVEHFPFIEPTSVTSNSVLPLPKPQKASYGMPSIFELSDDE
ncbi:Mu transposase C-terminal domain-containing protein [Paraburkholderia tagetis]|uniref:Mu transposase C-terminal domain-containing protein n=1 Tax=Paraburkholderia tagetis TaxID=2913261 RepID=A0A9X1RRZ2_9BURK|nr:Mu transposase C-terminal domain-containing protein [Paraburkholderia tagetis]MCG5076245.1 Mu transposase C-terminal domain-containing protein [Paraburkholderia tagetis]